MSWQQDPDSAEQGVETITKAMSNRSANGETDFHDAEMDFSPAQWKEIKEIYADTHSPEFEQMHPPARSTSPNAYLERQAEILLTPARTPNPSGQLNQHGRLIDGHSTRGMKSPGRGNYNLPSSSPARTPIASGANSPQHPGMWTSPHHRKNLPPMEMPSPSPPKRFGWLTPTGSRRPAQEPMSPEYSRASQQMRDPPEGNVPSSPARLMKYGKQSKLQHPVGSVSPARSIIGKEKFDKEGKSPAKSWKNLTRSISPLFGGRKSDHSVSSTLKTITRDLGASFQSSRRRTQANASVARATLNMPNWSGDSSVVAPDLEKDTTGTANAHHTRF